MRFRHWLLQEIKKTETLVGGKTNYDEFVDWAKGEADKIDPSGARVPFEGLEFHWARGSEDTKIIVYKDGDAIGYVSVSTFLDGQKINTLGLKPAARGMGVADKMYRHIVSKSKLYSDDKQTPEAQRLWAKMASRGKVMGFDPKSRRTFSVVNQGGELVSADPNFVLYSDNDEGGPLLVMTS